MARTSEGAKTASNMFDEDITSVYRLDLPESEPDAYTIQVFDTHGEDEQYMLNAFHQQYVAVEGRSAMAKLVDTRAGELGTHASLTMAMTMEGVERIETATQLGRLAKRQQDFDNKLLDQTARHLLETNGIAARTMHEDMRRPVYKPPPLPPQRKRKGLIPAVVEILFGEG